jgi:hypothetical protein
MAQYIDKNRVEEILRNLWKKDDGTNSKHQICYNKALQEVQCELDTLEVKEVDLDALGVLAEHLIACDAHLVTPKYTDKELNLLEEWAKNNKTQKGEEVS